MKINYLVLLLDLAEARCSAEEMPGQISYIKGTNGTRLVSVG
jgi:hypothetical protein